MNGSGTVKEAEEALKTIQAGKVVLKSASCRAAAEHASNECDQGGAMDLDRASEAHAAGGRRLRGMTKAQWTDRSVCSSKPNSHSHLALIRTAWSLGLHGHWQ